MKEKLNMKLKIKRMTKQRAVLHCVFLFLLFYTVFTLALMDKGDASLAEGIKIFTESAKQMFFKFKLSGRYTLTGLLHSLLTTLSLAALTTLIGAAAGLILGIAAAENISCKFSVKTVRAVMSIVRAVPTIIWVLIFSITAEVGAVAAIIGMSFHSTAYLVKGFSETFEQIDKNTINALKACGAAPSEIFTQAILPSSLNSLISWTFFRFEINFGNAVVLGAAAGAGGIGYELFMAGNMYFDMSEVGILSYLIFAAAALLEISSSKIRSTLRNATAS